MNQIFFIADTHFGHGAICKYRPQFSCPEEHDEFIISNWNSVVTKARQHVWCLGDMCFKNKYYAFDTLLSRLNGTIHVVPGNHCYLPAYKNLIKERALVARYGFWLSHAPIHPAELRGRCNVHGHVHYATLNDKRYFNVSCENIAYTPIDLDVIKTYFGELL